MPAVYVYPSVNTLKVLDTQASKFLRMQVRGAVNQYTQPYTTNQVLAANYPWVAAYVSNNWVHIFPWLKDTEIVEGFNLYDYMPTNFDNGFKLMNNYLIGSTNLLAFASNNDDSLLSIYPKFISSTLSNTAPGLSMDDLGVRWVNRPKTFTQWSDFPKPWMAPTNATGLDTLSSTAITNVAPSLTQIFDVLYLQIASVQNTNKEIFVGELRLADLHNRRLLIRHEKTGANLHNVILSLSAYRTNATGPTNFAFGDALLNSQQVKMALDSSDIDLKVTLTYLRHRSFTGTELPDHWTPYLGLSSQVLVTDTYTIKKGDLAAFCMNYGKVTRPMLNVHAQELWNMERILAASPSSTNTFSPDLYQGGTAYLMGMSYYERLGKFETLAEKLHKARYMSAFADGFALLAAKRVSGQLPNQGDIILTQPKLDMKYLYTTLVNNDSIHPDSGADPQDDFRDFRAVMIADGSAEEHATINRFFKQSAAISTVKLLQIASTNGGVLRLNSANYIQYGNTSFGGTLLKDHDAGLWSQVTAFLTAPTVGDHNIAFVTPGAVNVSGIYKGMGAMLWSPYYDAAAIIGQNLNGGVGAFLSESSFTSANLLNYSVGLDADENFYVSLTSPGSGNLTLAPDQVAVHDTTAVINNGNANYYQTTPLQNIASDQYFNAGMIPSALPGETTDQRFADRVQADSDRGFLGWLSSAASKAGSIVYDPVNVVSGEFYHNEVDLNLPGPFPLDVRRNYSSLNLAENQFGYGWKMSLMPFLSVSLDNAIIYGAEMDGAVLAYQKQGTNNLWIPTTAKNPLLDNFSPEGIGSTANRLRNKITLSGSTYTLTAADGSVRTFQTAPYAGFSSVKPYLLKWQDNRGNYLTFEYGTDSTKADFTLVRRIQSSNGNFLGFYYDVFGHIIEAYSGDGRRLKYDYDEFGDLVQVTLPDASTVGYEYEHLMQSVTNGVVTTVPYSTHLILKENKPDGRVLKNQYDSNRRVITQWSTVGPDLKLVKNAEFVYSNNFNLTNSFSTTITGFTQVKDVFTNILRYDYTNGLIGKITDPLTNTVEQYWYADNAVPPGYPRSLWKQKDKRGLWVEMQYDGNGNMTNAVRSGDLFGDTTTQYATNSYKFNTNSLVTEVTDPAGNKIQTVYDSTFPFLPKDVIRVAGSTPISTNRFTYYSMTNVFTSGGVTYTNMALGLMKQETRAFSAPDQAVKEWGYDGRGFPTQSIAYTGTSDPNVTNTFVYNARGEMVQQTDGAGRKTKLDYDGLGRLRWKEVYEAGQTVPLAWESSYYNGNGEVTWSDGPRFNPEDYVWRDHDGAGRLTTEIRWRSEAKSDGTDIQAPAGDALYATTFKEYDAFGNLTRIIDPRGGMTTNRWDALGRLIQRQMLETNGTVLSTEQFSYEPGDQVTKATNALGGVTETLYTSTGKPRYQKNADGSTAYWRYYRDGRIDREIQRNGAYWKSTYDDANRLTARVFYTAAGTALATNMVELDRRGNSIRTVDALGTTTTNYFDGLDRLKGMAGPLIQYIPPEGAPPLPGGTPPAIQQTSTNFYDYAGVVTTNANGLGDKTIVSRDALNRVTRTEVRNSAGTLVRESSIAYDVGHHGYVSTDGSGTNAVNSYTFTDNQGHLILTAGYPATNQYVYTLSQYDLGGNLLSSSKKDGTGILTTESYTYDGLNRMRSKTDRDNALTTFDYDAGGNLTNRIMPGGVKWRATYNNANQMLTEFNLATDGSGARTNSYSYYTSTNFAGLLQTKTDGRGVVCTHSYDDWLHLVSAAYSGSGAENNLTTTWGYDALGSLTNVTENFASTNTGPATVVNRAYDAYKQVVGENVQVGGTYVSMASPNWDAAGRRLSLGLGSFGYNYTWRADGLLASATGPTGGGSYTYSTAGLLTSRSVGSKSVTVTARDGLGRITGQSTTVPGGYLTETISWSNDNLINSHTVARPDMTDSRVYSYASLSRRLTQEALNVNSGTRWTNVFQYDRGTAAGPGVLTKAGQSVGGGISWDGSTNAFNRVATGTNNVARRLAYGTVNGPAKVSIKVDGIQQPFTTVGSANLQWRSYLELTPGTHTLVATAVHPSNLYTNSTQTTFTNSAVDRATLNYDLSGQVSQRVWKNGSGQTNRIQTFTWDGRGRLFKLSEREGTSLTDGYDWSAVYDGFGRRISTTTIVVSNSVAFTSQPKTITSYFDPTVEFLELGVLADGKTTWKLFGPDSNGRYGGMNGVGGFDAIVPGPELFCPVLTDVRGNVHAVFDQSHASLSWNGSRPTGYGSVPGYRPPAFANGASIVQASAWRGRWADVSGFYNLGARYYDPVEGHFVSCDPLGHDSDPSLYAFAGGDPINYFDPDGRYGKVAWGYGTGFIEGATEGLGNEAIGVGRFAYGMTVGLGEQITLTGMDIAEANYGGTEFNGAIFKGTFNMSLNGATTGDLITEGALQASGYRFGNQIFASLEQGVATGDYSGFSQNMGQVAAMTAGPKVINSASAAIQSFRTGAFLDPLTDFHIAGADGPSAPNMGPVYVNPPPNATPAQIRQVEAYVDAANRAIADDAISAAGRVPTKGSLRGAASRAAAAERERAAGAGTPYQGQAGHVPDTTWTGTPEPHSWLDLDAIVNSSIGGQANRYPLGYYPTEFRKGR